MGYRGRKGRRDFRCMYVVDDGICPLEVHDTLRGRPVKFCKKHRKDITKAIARAYYYRNHEARMAYAAKHRTGYNPVYGKTYREKNREKLRKYAREYYHAHKPFK
uniref:Uncharacterized protein n=1 Tax=Nitrosopumivirus cobalaminus TaxID=3158414 RepID=A0AAU7N4B5_9VIRU